MGKAAAALGISIIADGLDYVGAPIFSMPVIGDIADLIVTGLLYRITRSKVSVFINAIEFIPFVGDIIPTYTISTLMWVIRESQKRKIRGDYSSAEMVTLPLAKLKTETNTGDQADASGQVTESFETQIRRASAIIRSRIF